MGTREIRQEGNGIPDHKSIGLGLIRHHFCKRQFERVEGVFERLAERPLLPFRDHKQALDRCRLGLDLDDDLDIGVVGGVPRLRPWGL